VLGLLIASQFLVAPDLRVTRSPSKALADALPQRGESW